MAGTNARVKSQPYLETLSTYRGGRLIGKVQKVIGLVVEVTGIRPFIGEVCKINTINNETLEAEVVGFREKSSLLMPLGELKGVYPGCAVLPTGKSFTVQVGEGILGLVLDGLGRPLDGRPLPLEAGEAVEYPVNNTPPNPLDRKPVDQVLHTGIKVVDGLLTCGRGQRIGIFSGSGVGKSTFLGMIARHSKADVNVIALIGERGREVGNFIQRELADCLHRSVVIVSTSDRPAMERVIGALVAMSIAEYFRDRKADVIFLMDSVTRLCMAQREIGLAVGEPPSTKGYTPSVFALLSRYLERAGNSRHGSISGYYSVLVEGDDFNEPITDAVRGILDGHIVLTRELAEQNHFPALDVLKSNSRLMLQLVDEEHKKQASEIKKLLATYKSAEDLINIGAYEKGSQEDIDRAIDKRPAILEFLQQGPMEEYSFEETRALMGRLLD